MSIIFCEKTFNACIDEASNTSISRFYLPNSILLKINQGKLSLRIDEGEWCKLTVNNLCFLPKGKVIEIIKETGLEPLNVDALPISTQRLHHFYKQNSALFLDKKNTRYQAQVCTTDISNMPILGDVFYSAIQNIRHLGITADHLMKQSENNKITIHLNFVLSFFLLENMFYPTLQASINIAFRDKVYDYIYHNSGKQDCSLGAIAKQLHVSASTLKRRLANEETNFSTISLMSRMNKAMMLSKVYKMPMSRIAQEVGYDDIPHFFQTFKKFHQQNQSFNITLN